MFQRALGPPTVGGWFGEGEFFLLLGVILLAGAGTAVLFAVSFVAYRRRQTRKYALVSVAVGFLLLRSIVGTGTVFGAVPMVVHHLVSHSFDFAIAACVLYAVYRSGPSTETVAE